MLLWSGTVWADTEADQDVAIWNILEKKTTRHGYKGPVDHLKVIDDGSIQYASKADRDWRKKQNKSVSKDVSLKMLSWHLSMDDMAQEEKIDHRVKQLKGQVADLFNQHKAFPNLYIFTGIRPVSSLRSLKELCQVLLGRDFKPEETEERCRITRQYDHGVEASSPYMLVSEGIAVIGRSPVRAVPGVIEGTGGYCSIQLKDETHKLAYLLYFEVSTIHGWTKVAVVSGNDHTNMSLAGYDLEAFWRDCLTYFLVKDLKVVSPGGEPVAVLVRSLNREGFESEFRFWLEAPELSVMENKKDFDPEQNKLAAHVASDFTLKRGRRQLTRVYYYRQGKFRPTEGKQKVISVQNSHSLANNNGSSDSGVAHWAEGESRDITPFAINFSTLKIPEKQEFREVSHWSRSNKASKSSSKDDDKLYIYLPEVTDY
ncbi:hypothetical protein [Endozoicomonas arenosclerae]|uniref:hypothetical protein n=1 Tax=Endozoicomonas arenosclerae TaxID=1633495 RepID=UPI001560BC73|nr:hypothetical protein [Endozoicomonas arenosclerae]